MIHINHKDFEKISGAGLKFIVNTVKDLIGPAEKAVVKDRTSSIAKSKAQGDSRYIPKKRTPL